MSSWLIMRDIFERRLKESTEGRGGSEGWMYIFASRRVCEGNLAGRKSAVGFHFW